MHVYRWELFWGQSACLRHHGLFVFASFAPSGGEEKETETGLRPWFMPGAVCYMMTGIPRHEME